MKKLVSYLLFLSLVIVGCSVDHDSLQDSETLLEKSFTSSENELVDRLGDERISVSLDRPDVITLNDPYENQRIITIKYKNGTPERIKVLIRNNDFEKFTLLDVGPTVCDMVETWTVLLKRDSNGDVVDDLPTGTNPLGNTEEYEDPDRREGFMLSYIENIIVGTVMNCTKF